ncbi:phage holin family protein [Microbacterium amylolyticum]|uniref:Membrane protein n=1 Tax=Microbacterium amylolyticum TaxID=936337 RepID=A0ABS4ZI75_9MICO|nr:phage holin family protein [Microbacterium amylolyticum]MBP2436978.1 putative membrane protein [Microbacterium amylolyticum]
MRFLITSIMNGFAIWVLTLIPFLSVSITPFGGDDMWWFLFTLVAIGALFGIVNAIIRPIIKVVAFPLFVLTLGLIALAMNGFLLLITAWFTSFWHWGLDVGGFWSGVGAGIILAIINMIFGIVLRPQKKRR